MLTLKKIMKFLYMMKINKIFLYAKNPYEAKDQFLIKKGESSSLKERKMLCF